MAFTLAYRLFLPNTWTTVGMAMAARTKSASKPGDFFSGGSQTQQRDRDAEDRSLAQLALHHKRTLVRGHDGVAHGQPEPRSLTHLPGREEGIEDPILEVIGDAHPRVANLGDDRSIRVTGV